MNENSRKKVLLPMAELKSGPILTEKGLRWKLLGQRMFLGLRMNKCHLEIEEFKHLAGDGYCTSISNKT